MGNRSEYGFLEGEGGFTMEFHFLNELFGNLFPQGRKPSLQTQTLERSGNLSSISIVSFSLYTFLGVFFFFFYTILRNSALSGHG